MITYVIAFVLGTMTMGFLRWYFTRDVRRKVLSETAKKMEQAEVVSNMVGSLSARELVERANRRWAERIAREKQEDE